MRQSERSLAEKLMAACDESNLSPEVVLATLRDFLIAYHMGAMGLKRGSVDDWMGRTVEKHTEELTKSINLFQDRTLWWKGQQHNGGGANG